MRDRGLNQERLARVLARRYRTSLSGALVASVVLHLFLFILWPDALIFLYPEGSEIDRARLRTEPPQLVQLATPPPDAVIVQAPPRVEVADIRIRTPVVSPSAPDFTRIPDAELPPARLAPGRALAAEPEQYNQPIARNILPDWTFPESLHGVSVTARTFVNVAGRSTGIVELVPPTDHRTLNREIVSLIRRLDYQPAYRNGKPVAEWAEITFTFCGKSVRATSPAAPRDRVAPCAESVAVAADTP